LAKQLFGVLTNRFFCFVGLQTSFSVLFLSKTMAMTEEVMSWLQANNLADLSASLANAGFIDLHSIYTITERYWAS
jgi:hypothetical protein